MIEKHIADLLEYAKIHLDLEQDDVNLVRNNLMELLDCNEVYCGEVDRDCISKLTVCDQILENIANYAIQNNLVDSTLLPNFLSKVMGYVTPIPSVVKHKFNSLVQKNSIDATNYLYNLSIKNNYIQKSATDRNIFWQKDFEDKSIQLAINLSKPEKSNAEIAKLLTQKSTNYPKCMLCVENEGFFGNLKKPSRQNLRQIDLVLGGEKWFFQYSPYVYYNQHSIVISYEHKPMKVDVATFEKLADFVDIFPHYFVGSNASLPIVGGSILNHEHFQAGRHRMPLHSAKSKRTYKVDGVDVSQIDYYNNCIRLECSDRKKLIQVASKIFEKYLTYSDDSIDLIAKTDRQHNAIAPIMRKERGIYILDLILRNNRTNEQYPDGIFHAHREYFDIKSEGIGLIESQGLFILPPKVLTNMQNNPQKYTKDYISNACTCILQNTAVFKTDKDFDRFWKALLEC